ncbi:MAG TPA: TlpA disulfide reductase family protein [Pyrinomonadaceae bacterium]|jgi:thiol-disulfide isomerase/thioredoxin|nr:TlpA disulfide reductase family protein [Pyrinomonadaceae bacterium]
MKHIKSVLAVFGLLIAFSFAARAQAVSLVSLDGEKVNITGQNGKVVILAVGATWLPLSKDQVVITNKLAKKYAGRDVVVYFIATDSANAKSKNFASNDEISDFAAKNKLGVTILRDSDGLLTLKKFAIDQLPSFVILDKTGKSISEPFGGIDPKNDISIPISKAIDKIL